MRHKEKSLVEKKSLSAFLNSRTVQMTIGVFDMKRFAISLKRPLKIVCVLVGMATLAGCANGFTPNKAQIGGAVGAVGGAILGSQIGPGGGRAETTAAIAAGTMLGYFLGSQVGSYLDEADRLMMERAQNRANTAPIGETITWNNPKSGHRGTVTPTRDGRDNRNRYCREYTSTIYVDGWEEEAVGIACQNRDGTWDIASNGHGNDDDDDDRDDD